MNSFLKSYQRIGCEWLIDNYKTNINCILADEMGLGKTIQIIALINYIKSQKLANQILIVVPLSLINNWEMEIVKFGQDLNVCKYVGNFRKLESKFITLTTYEMCINEKQVLGLIHWDLLVVDEAHRLKNSNSVLYNELLQYEIEHKILLTGTPVQNNLSELNSLLHFLHPDLFMRNPDSFVKEFGSNDKSDAQIKSSLDSLKNKIRPFILRREKRDVEINLPPKQELVLYTGISALQKKLYKAILQKDIASIISNKTTSLNNVLMHLRKCINHPYLFPGIEKEPFEIGEHLIEASGKLWLLDRLLSYLHQRGHRVLLFSQMTGVLDILQDYLTFRGYSYDRLDGSIRSEERYAAVNRFTNDKDVFVFLLSTRAGGVGLNLAEADTVIFYDSDFNPQADLQAMSRAHRIGQVKPVTVLRLVARGTVEELILKRATKKLELSTSIFNTGEFTAETISPKVKTLEDISTILKFGIDKMLEDEEGTITDKDLDQLFQIHSISFDVTQGTDMKNSLMGSTAPTSSVADSSSSSSIQSVPVTQNYQEKDLSNSIDDMYTFGGEKYSRDTKALMQLADSKNIDLDILNHGRLSKNPTNFDADVKQLELKQQELKVLNREKREKKKLELWNLHGYKSLSFKESWLDEDELLKWKRMEFDDSELSISYKIGDVTKPETSSKTTQIIIHCVDNSGQWSNRGLFGALDRLDENIRHQYILAGEMKDLHLGDLHLIPSGDNYLIALLVVQTRDKSGFVSPINPRALEIAFMKLKISALHCDASINMPRIGWGTQDFNWYQVEKMCNKYFCTAGIETYVYYFRRH